MRDAMPGETVLVRGVELQVGDDCGGAGGRWHCSTHDETFAHNLARESHCSSEHIDECVLVWVCVLHGVEQP